METIKFGINELDTLLGGGVAKGKTYLLEYSVSSKPLSFVSAFLRQGYLTNELCKVDSFDYPFTEIMIELENMKFEALKAANEGRLLTIDYMSGIIYGSDASGPHLLGKGELDKRQVTRLSQIAWEKIDSGKVATSGLRQAIHSLSSFIRHFGFEECLGFVSNQVVMTRKRGGVLVATVNPEMLNPMNLATLEEGFDGIIETSVAEENMKFQKYIRIKNSPYPFFRQERLPYEIVGVESQVSIASKLAEEFESFKANIKMIQPGVVDILGTKICMHTTKGLAILQKAIFDRLGYEKGWEMLYEWGIESLETFLKPIYEKMKAKLSLTELAEGPSAIRDMFTSFVSSRGFGEPKLISYDMEKRTARVRLINSPTGIELKGYGKAVDAFIAGCIAGVITLLIGGNVVCNEVSCLAKGDESCIFEAVQT